MTSHTEQFQTHQLWETLDNLDEALAVDFDEDDLDQIERLRSIARHVRSRLDQSDPNLVPLPELDSIRSPMHQIVTNLGAYATSGNEQHLNAAIAQVDPLLQKLAPLWSARTGEDVGQIRDDVASFRKSASLLVNGLRSEIDEANETLRSLSETRDALRDEIDEQHGRLDTAITEHQSQFSVAQDTRSTEHDSARSKRQATFNEQTAALELRADELLKEIAQDAADDHESDRSNHAEHLVKARGTLAELNQLKDKAAKVVGVVGNIGMTGDYQKIAQAEKDDAEKWSQRALVFFILALLIAGAVLILGTDDLGAAGSGRRIALSIAAFTPATYCTTQSREHRRVETRNRSMELELASLDPFIAQLPEDYQQAMKAELATRYFRGSESVAGELDVDGRLARFLEARKARAASESSEDED